MRQSCQQGTPCCICRLTKCQYRERGGLWRPAAAVASHRAWAYATERTPASLRTAQRSRMRVSGCMITRSHRLSTTGRHDSSRATSEVLPSIDSLGSPGRGACVRTAPTPLVGYWIGAGSLTARFAMSATTDRLRRLPHIASRLPNSENAKTAEERTRRARISPLTNGTSRSEERSAPFVVVLLAVFAFMLLPSRRSQGLAEFTPRCLP
jgi:hypothetical protein